MDGKMMFLLAPLFLFGLRRWMTRAIEAVWLWRSLLSKFFFKKKYTMLFQK